MCLTSFYFTCYVRFRFSFIFIFTLHVSISLIFCNTILNFTLNNLDRCLAWLLTKKRILICRFSLISFLRLLPSHFFRHPLSSSSNERNNHAYYLPTRRCLCELARQIGFQPQASNIFEYEAQIASYRHLVSVKFMQSIIRFNLTLFLSTIYKLTSSTVINTTHKHMNSNPKWFDAISDLQNHSSWHRKSKFPFHTRFRLSWKSIREGCSFWVRALPILFLIAAMTIGVVKICGRSKKRRERELKIFISETLWWVWWDFNLVVNFV